MAIVNMANIKNIHTDDEANVYYNIRIYNPLTKAIQAIFSENRVEAILENPSEYELAVVRFSVPANFIPIFLWEEPSKYSIHMRFDGLIIDTTCVYIPRANNPNNPPFGKAIWNYQEFIDIINQALKTCWNTMSIAKPLQPTTEPPFMTYDAKSSLCSLYAEQLYDSSTNTIEIMFSKNLYVLFPSFQSFVQTINPNLTHYQVLIKNNNTNFTTFNSKQYYIMEQEYQTLFLWNSFKSLLFETDNIPTEPEFQPSQTNITRRLLTDFEPISEINNRQTFQYFPQGPIRFYDLTSKYPMNRMDMRVFWETRDGTTYPIYLGEGDVLTMKILFRKKTTKQLEQFIFHNGDDTN